MEDRDEKVVAVELDNQSKAPGIAVSAEPTPERSRVNLSSPVNEDGVLGALATAGLPMSVDDVDM